MCGGVARESGESYNMFREKLTADDETAAGRNGGGPYKVVLLYLLLWKYDLHRLRALENGHSKYVYQICCKVRKSIDSIPLDLSK